MAHHTGSKGNETVHVTDIALGTCRNMRSRLAQRIDCSEGTVMTGRTLASQTCVVHPCRLECCVIGMTSITLSACGDMRRRFAKHAGAVVTGRTSACCRGIVRIGRTSPGDGRLVAGIALCCSRHVGRRFSTGVDCSKASVMTTRAVAVSRRPGCAAMVHGRRSKGAGAGVAGITLRSGWDMVGWLAKRRRAVVAGRAAACNRRSSGSMIKGAGCPAYR